MNWKKKTCKIVEKKKVVTFRIFESFSGVSFCTLDFTKSSKM